MAADSKPKRGVPQRRVGNVAELIQAAPTAAPVDDFPADIAPDPEAETLWEELMGGGKPGQSAAKAPGARVNDRYIPIERIFPNRFQPRLFIPKARVEKRKKSMDKQGQLQSALARPYPGRPGYFELADGNIRFLAVKAGANAGLKEPNAPELVGTLRLDILALEDEEMLDAAWDANEERDDFSAFDRANYFVMARDLESKLAGRSSPVANAPDAKNRGAAQTSDGLLSWEELYSIRKKKDKPLPPASTMRRAVSILGLPDKLKERLSNVNFAAADDPDEKFKGIAEKHARAVLSIPEHLQRLTLVSQIEKEKISGNEAEKRALATNNRTKKEEREREKNAKKDPREEEAKERLRQVLEAAKAKFFDDEKRGQSALLAGISPNATPTDQTPTDRTPTAPVEVQNIVLAPKAASSDQGPQIFAAEIAEECDLITERLQWLQEQLEQSDPDPFLLRRLSSALGNLATRAMDFQDTIRAKPATSDF